ncbi:MAG: glycyl-radical enzyme activating protein [Candidatus Hodarchaeales archaeon]
MNTHSGTIFDIKRFAVHDGPGIRTTVFFKGCSLNCWWCHNPESQNSEPETILRPNSLEEEIVGKTITIADLMDEIRKDLIFYDESGGGMTVSGGEPLMQPDFLVALLTECNQEKIHTAVDTTGHGSSDILKTLLGKVNLYLFDLKFIDDEKHHEYTGVSNRSIIHNIKYLDSEKASVIIRIPIIPGVTDTETNIYDLGVFISSSIQTIKKVNILPYNRFGEGKYPRLNRPYRFTNQLKTPSDKKLNKIKNELETYGLDVQVGG